MIYIIIYLGIGLMLVVILDFYSGNLDLKFSVVAILVWPFIVYWGTKWLIMKTRVHRLKYDDVKGFCKLMKIQQIEKARNEITRCYIYTITFKNKKERRFTVYDQEVIDALMDKDNGILSVLVDKILYKKETE